MSTTFRALVRVFGPFESTMAVRKLFLKAEIGSPSYSFSVDILEASGTDTGGYVIKGEMNRRPPSFAELDFLSDTFAKHQHLVIELLIDADDSQTHKVFQAGQLIYEGTRQEATGDIYELGAPGLTYCYGTESGIRDAFLIAVDAAAGSHHLKAL